MEDIKKLLQKKNKPRIENAVFGVIFLAFALLGLMLTINSGKDDPAEAQAFTSLETKGSYVYLDIMQVDAEYVAYDDNNYWYTVVGTDHYYYMAKIDKSDMKRLSTQIDNWINDVEDGESLRLYGTAVYDYELLEVYQEVYGFDSISEVEEYFGDNYIDTTFTPSNDKSATGIICGIMFGALGGYFIYLYLKADKSCTKLINAILNSDDANMIAEDINVCGPVYKAGEFVFGERIFVTKNYVVPYRDIIWAYPRTTSYNYVFHSYFVVIKDRYGNEISVPFKKKDEKMEAMLNSLYEKNDEILFGYTPSNIKYYRDFMKQNKA